MLYNRNSLNYWVHKITNTSFDGSKDDLCPEEKVYNKAEIKELFSNFNEVNIQVDYLFGTGYKWVNNIVPMFVKKYLGKYVGWHLMIWAKK